VTLRTPSGAAAGASATPAADLPSLRRSIIGAFAIVFAGALLVAGAGILLLVPHLSVPAAAAWALAMLGAALAFFSWLGAVILRRRLLGPMAELAAALEAIDTGDQTARVPAASTAEMARLARSADAMAQRLVARQHALAANIRSLDETNRLLTEARDAMIRAEKLASAGRLGTGIAHEVGNPLSAILGYLGLLARKTDGPDLELVQAAEREAKRIDRIIRGLLDYARPRDAVAQRVDVVLVAADTMDLVRTQGVFSHVGLEGVLPAEPPMIVDGDPYQLQQVLVNLLVNAADALAGQRNGSVRLVVTRRRALPAPPRSPARRQGDPEGIDYSHRRRLNPSLRWPVGDPASPSGEVVEITVSDNGPGIPHGLIDQLFEPFVTTKEPGEGTGLGLALSARLVEGMGGTIHAASPGQGAEFRVVLPAVDHPPDQ
jgi:two-component system, NtrC family, sensor kinase